MNDDETPIANVFCGWHILHASHQGEMHNGGYMRCEGWQPDE